MFKNIEKSKLITYLISINGMAQLAISPVYINTVVKSRSTTIGFFLFCYILFGLVSFFESTKIHKTKDSIVTIITTLCTVIFGVYFLILGFGNSVDSSDVMLSAIVVGISSVVFIFSIVMTIFYLLKGRK